jgi:hypothetical protein
MSAIHPFHSVFGGVSSTMQCGLRFAVYRLGVQTDAGGVHPHPPKIRCGACCFDGVACRDPSGWTGNPTEGNANFRCSRRCRDHRDGSRRRDVLPRRQRLVIVMASVLTLARSATTTAMGGSMKTKAAGGAPRWGTCVAALVLSYPTDRSRSLGDYSNPNRWPGARSAMGHSEHDSSHSAHRRL